MKMSPWGKWFIHKRSQNGKQNRRHHHLTESSHSRLPLVEERNLSRFSRMAKKLRRGRERRSICSTCSCTKDLPYPYWDILYSIWPIYWIDSGLAFQQKDAEKWYIFFKWQTSQISLTEDKVQASWAFGLWDTQLHWAPWASKGGCEVLRGV